MAAGRGRPAQRDGGQPRPYHLAGLGGNRRARCLTAVSAGWRQPRYMQGRQAGLLELLDTDLLLAVISCGELDSRSLGRLE